MTLVTIITGAIIGFAALVHGAVGIGFPLIATPLLAMMSDVRTAVLLLVIPTVCLNAVSVVTGGNSRTSVARYWPLAVYGTAGNLIGTNLLIGLPDEYFRPVLAAMLVFYLNAERLGVGFSWIRRYPRVAMAVFGLAAGILGGTVNVMLPALVIYALEIRMPKGLMIQVFNLCFLTGKLMQGAVLAHSGWFTADILKTSGILAVAALVFSLGGMAVRDRISARTFRIWLRRLLAVMAAILMVQFFRY